MFFYTFLSGFIFPAGTALALSDFSLASGITSGVLVSCKMLIAAIATYIVATIGSSEPIVFSLTLVTTGAFSFLVCRFGLTPIIK